MKVSFKRRKQPGKFNACKFYFENNQAVYELCGAEHHDHLVCVKCNKIIEFQDDVIEKHQIQIAKKHGFDLTDHSLYLYGLCEDCH